jgi:hypothetical protein
MGLGAVRAHQLKPRVTVPVLACPGLEFPATGRASAIEGDMPVLVCVDVLEVVRVLGVEVPRLDDPVPRGPSLALRGRV